MGRDGYAIAAPRRPDHKIRNKTRMAMNARDAGGCAQRAARSSNRGSGQQKKEGSGTQGAKGKRT